MTFLTSCLIDELLTRYTKMAIRGGGEPRDVPWVKVAASQQRKLQPFVACCCPGKRLVSCPGVYTLISNNGCIRWSQCFINLFRSMAVERLHGKAHSEISFKLQITWVGTYFFTTYLFPNVQLVRRSNELWSELLIIVDSCINADGHEARDVEPFIGTLDSHFFWDRHLRILLHSDFRLEPQE